MALQKIRETQPQHELDNSAQQARNVLGAFRLTGPVSDEPVILVDTSVWIDHLRAGDADLAGLLGAGLVLAHLFVTGEVALGNLRQRARSRPRPRARPTRPT